MKERLDKSKAIQERLKKLREKLLQKKEASWQDKKDLEKLLKEQKELHRKVAKAIEELFTDRNETFYNLLSCHFAKASEWNKACRYFALACYKKSLCSLWWNRKV